jgi:hypothetical protein
MGAELVKSRIAFLSPTSLLFKGIYVKTSSIYMKGMLLSRAMDTPDDLILSTEGRKLLGISPTKMSELLRKNVIRYFPNPLDAREKLVSKAEVMSLIPKRAEAA